MTAEIAADYTHAQTYIYIYTQWWFQASASSGFDNCYELCYSVLIPPLYYT